MEEQAQLEIAARVAQVRAKIQRHGESRVTCEELRLLCGGAIDPHEQLKAVTQIAQWESWTFEFLPDGSVRFTNVPTPPPGLR